MNQNNILVALREKLAKSTRSIRSNVAKDLNHIVLTKNGVQFVLLVITTAASKVPQKVFTKAAGPKSLPANNTSNATGSD